MLALSSLVTGATQSPQEILALEAGRIFEAGHTEALLPLLEARGGCAARTREKCVPRDTARTHSRCPTFTFFAAYSRPSR